MVVSNQSTHIGVLATAAHAATEKLRFSVIYHPRSVVQVLTQLKYLLSCPSFPFSTSLMEVMYAHWSLKC
jgi:hypothetical protein